MDVYDAILMRRSTRSFNDTAVPSESIIKLLEAGRWAPTGGNIQPWKFIVVQNPKKIGMIKMFSEGLRGTPTLIIAICTENRNWVTLLDIGMAAENISLEAVELGLGTCAIASFSEPPIKKLLEIPTEIELILLLSIGYPDRTPRLREKKSLEEISYCEKYGGKLDL
jgi:nitroreductase